MSERNNFALVRKPSSAVEKIASSKKVILSGMVADTLAVARNDLEILFQRGLELQKSGEHKQAFSLFKQAAEKGHLNAQYKLGQCYLDGKGVTQSENDGVMWLEKALDRGLGNAGFVLGNYFSDFSLQPNYPKATKYHQRAVDLGYERSAGNLANILERLDKASETPAIQKKAERGDVKSCLEMGKRYLEGLGVPQDTIEAGLWFTKAAKIGDDVDAWCYLGFLFEAGKGMPRDLKEAIECFRIAAELGSDVAHDKLVELNALE